MTTGQRIKEARKRAGMTQSELAQHLNIPFQSVSQWERDLRNPKIETLQRIAAVLNVDVNWLKHGQTLEQRDQAMKDYVKRRFSEAKGGNIIHGSTLTYEQQCEIYEANSRNRLEAAYARLDLIGHQKVADYAEKLTKDPKRLVDPEYPYRYPPQSTPASSEGSKDTKDTAPASEAPERPQEDEE